MFAQSKRVDHRKFHRSLTVLAKVSLNSSQVLVTYCYVTMLFAVNLSSNHESLLIVFFSIAVLAMVTVNSSQVVVT